MIHDYGLDNLFINLNILVKSYECNKTLSEQDSSMKSILL